MSSSDIVIEAPFSFTGSAKRIWRLSNNVILRILLLIPLTGLVWGFVLLWYCTFGLLLVPYRLIRKSQRKQKVDRLRHEELLKAVTKDQV